MPHIRGTNIVVDEFRLSGRSGAEPKFLFFLSHFHADHYPGLASSFRAGPIYCTDETAVIALAKFPGIDPLIVRCKYNEECTLTLSEEHQLHAKFTFMDANHIIGSAMILFEGYFGRVLYTGDMRYHDKLVRLNTPLFHADGALRAPIDEVVLDNTYCDPVFNFPAQDRCVEIVAGIIEQNLRERGAGLRVFLYSYSVGKEEICLELARRFRTKVVLEAQRWKMISRLDYHMSFFTKNAAEGFIHLVRGSQRQEKLQCANSIHVSLTGWINCPRYLCLARGQYLVAYSSHSNYQELDRFVALVRPARLSSIVSEREHGCGGGEGVKSLQGCFAWLKFLRQRGPALLREKYVDAGRASAEYARLADPTHLQELYRQLGVERGVEMIEKRALAREDTFLRMKAEEEALRGRSLPRDKSQALISSFCSKKVSAGAPTEADEEETCLDALESFHEAKKINF